MHERCTAGLSSKRPLCLKIRAKEGVLMNKLVARLIDCGMTRSVAFCVLRQFRDLQEAERYVEQIEEASCEQMAILSE